ncbi:MAG: dicarboxylate/amino acid:cation symporter [Hyphomicrobiaceae bacterium]|nr:dicarboxylate/amino acid:cation symporter [Hyphomicrobiaceae bacterium]
MSAKAHPKWRIAELSLTSKVIIGMCLGLITGVILNLLASPVLNEYLVSGLFSMIGKMFLNALKMLVVPLVVFSLICGVVGIGDLRTLGRVGGKAFVLYIATTALAVSVAIALAHAIGPGSGFDMSNVATSGMTAKATPNAWDVFADIVPDNPVAALANGRMLQIIFYVIVVAVAALMLGDRSKSFVEACEYLNELSMKIVEIVMAFAPYGVFCLIAKTFAQEGVGLFLPVIAYVATLTSALLLHLLVTLMILLKVFSGLDPITFLRKLRPAQVFAFSTASSNATIPITFQCVTQRIGADNSVASFTVPLGATINMDGTAIMQGVATVFFANVYGIDLGLMGYVTVVLMAVLASIGTAGVPGVGLVMLTMVLGQVGLPIEGIAIILGVDRIMDMIRTVVNITGDAVVSSIVAKSEGKLDLAIFNDPEAGTLSTDELEIDLEAEARLAAAARPHRQPE